MIDYVEISRRLWIELEHFFTLKANKLTKKTKKQQKNNKKKQKKTTKKNMEQKKTFFYNTSLQCQV